MPAMPERPRTLERPSTKVKEASTLIFEALKKDYGSKIKREPESSSTELITISDVKLGYAADKTVFKNVTIKIRVIERKTMVMVKLCVYGKPNDIDDEKVEVEVQRLLTYINFGMLYGTFEMKPVTANRSIDAIPPGTIRYRRSVTVPHTNIPSAVEMVKEAVDKGCDIVACFSEMIESVRTGGFSQEKAVMRHLGKIKDSDFYRNKVMECFDDEF